MPEILLDPIMNRIITSLIQIAMISFDVFVFRAIWQSEKADPFILAPIMRRHAEREARAMRTVRIEHPETALAKTDAHMWHHGQNVPLVQIRRKNH